MTTSNTDATRRFSDRVEDYVRYRPGYPNDLIEYLVGLGGQQVADIGSGTGILTDLLLDRFETVFAVEPNPDMRAAAARALVERAGFTSIDATAEATTLPNQSVDLVCAAQAFHWFEPATTRTEFFRILRPGGYIALIWNQRQVDTTPFLAGYEALLLQWATDYTEVDHRNAQRNLNSFFQNIPYQTMSFPNEQRFDRAGLRGRLRSSSYTPPPGHPNHAPMMAALDQLFDTHAADGHVQFLYTTELYWGAVNLPEQ